MFKKLTLIFAVLTSAATFSFAQNNAGEFAIYQSVFGMEKQALIKESLILTEEQADLFWPIYNAYESERKEEGKKLFDLLKKYGDEFDTLTDEQADEIVKEAIALRIKREKLLKKYYGKVKKVTNAKVAGTFIQIENYIHTAVKLELMDNLPFIQDTVQ